MTFTAPLGLLALLAIPAVVALHLFRNRLPERSVAGLFLYPVSQVLADGGRTRTRRWRSPSLWLECLAALLAALWLGGCTFSDLLPRHLVVVLDDSASMSASGVRARAAAAIDSVLEQLSADDEVTVVRSGPQPEVVLGPRAAVADFEPALAAWLPTRSGHAMQPTLDLARELAGRTGELLFVTDEDPGLAVDDLRVLACGQRQGNAALLSVRRARSSERDRLLVAVAAFGSVAGSELLVAAGSRELLRVPVTFPADGGDAQFALPLPPGSPERLLVQLTDDALAADNSSWLLPAPVRVVAVSDQLSPDLRQQLALDDVFDAMRDWQAEPDENRAQILLRDRAGVLRPGQLEVVIGRSPGATQGHRSPFVVDRSHPLLAGMALDGVAWQSGGGDLPGQVLVAAGAKVLLSEEWPAVGRRLWLNLDPSAGNLVRAPDWPILFANVLEAGRREAPGCRAHVLRVGEELVYRSGELRRPVVVRGPSGDVVARGSDGDVGCVAAEPGVYSVRSSSDEVLGEVSVRFVDPRESDLGRAVTFDREPSAAVRAASMARQDAGPMRRWLAVLLLAVVLLDWWLLSRQVE